MGARKSRTTKSEPQEALREGAPFVETDIENAIQKLKGKDAIGRAGEIVGTAGGVAAGASAAGAIAGAVGASTFLGSTTLGGLVGGVLVTATPIGWILGSAVVGGAAAYGIAKLIRSGARQDEIRDGLGKRLKLRLNALRGDRSAEVLSPILNERLDAAVQHGLLERDRADRMLSLVKKGALGADVALERVRRLLGEVPEKQHAMQLPKSKGT